MRDMPARVTAAELRLLKVLWEHPELSAREITGHLYSRTTNSDIGTVQTLLARLEAKGLVRRDRSQHVHRFVAVISRSDFAGRQLEEMVDKLADGSVLPLLAHLVQSAELSDADKAELRKLLNDDVPSKRKGAK
ncbi:MAG: BlaI/MecI/CopY family transcriptional regulator [Planctomycetia bacterium]|nr:BlaI/MecI/CopY family transcriptional regulator [Planctomycetia bacterium]